ncbi:MAG: S-layer homology domain-containing protein [Clostridia bacterium]|nr:S-layer homology domain-containing protein [Clostridia bacterium]
MKFNELLGKIGSLSLSAVLALNIVTVTMPVSAAALTDTVYIDENFDDYTDTAEASYTNGYKTWGVNYIISSNTREFVNEDGGALSGKSMKLTVGTEKGSQFRAGDSAGELTTDPTGYSVSLKFDSFGTENNQIKIGGFTGVMIGTDGTLYAKSSTNTSSKDYRLDTGFKLLTGKWYTLTFRFAEGRKDCVIIVRDAVTNEALTDPYPFSYNSAPSATSGLYFNLTASKGSTVYVDELKVFGAAHTTGGIYGRYATFELLEATPNTDTLPSVVVTKDGVEQDTGCWWEDGTLTVALGTGVGNYLVRVIEIEDISGNTINTEMAWLVTGSDDEVSVADFNAACSAGADSVKDFLMNNGSRLGVNKNLYQYMDDAALTDLCTALVNDIPADGYAGLQEICEAVEELILLPQYKALTTGEEILSFLDEKAGAIGMDTDVYDNLNEYGVTKLDVCKEIAAKKSGVVCNTLADICAFAEEQTLVTVMNMASVENVSACGEKLFFKLGLDKAVVGETYTSRKSIISEDVWNRVYDWKPEAGGFADLGAIEDAFNKSVILSAVAHATLYTETESILDSNDEFLQAANIGWDTTAYDALNDTKPVMLALTGQTYVDLAALKSAFDTAVAAQEDAEAEEAVSRQPSYGGSGGGGGGFGAVYGGTINYASESKTEAEDTTDEKLEEETDNIGQTAVFDDIGNVPWAAEAILALTEEGVINGKGYGHFCPDDKLTREEFAKMLVCAFVPEDEASELVFDDVVDGAWYAPYVSRAAAAGIVQGIGQGEFGIGNEISRQDLVVMCVRAAEYAEITLDGTTEGAFCDGEAVADYAKDAVEKLRNAGIISGDESNSFNPENGSTRAEAAKILYAVMNRGK